MPKDFTPVFKLSGNCKKKHTHSHTVIKGKCFFLFMVCIKAVSVMSQYRTDEHIISNFNTFERYKF